jgi:hypothetical protein
MDADILEDEVHEITQSKDDIVEHDLIFVDTSHDVHHHIALGLVEHNPVVVEDDVRGLFSCLIQEPLFKGLL